ncbi:LysR substrate-binding domain-containing protein [Novosphingobium capsulatum]|nr:LysR substrate-binding domain-containing protein [Novosphingobium capsulatum]
MDVRHQGVDGAARWAAPSCAGQIWAMPPSTKSRLRHQPRMTCSDFTAVRAAAIRDLGVALLPDHVCREALRQGLLVHILPEWRAQLGIVHLVFTTRRGLPPAVRALIDHLATTFPK